MEDLWFLVEGEHLSYISFLSLHERLRHADADTMRKGEGKEKRKRQE